MSNKEKRCKFCRSDGIKLTEEVEHWDLPTDVNGISSDLIFTNTENETTLAVEVKYVDSCYLDHSYGDKIMNINYCPMCGRKLRK